MVITGLYAGILALIYLVLTVTIVTTRYKTSIQFGDSGSDILMRRVRAHGNFIEYVPLALILMGILDTQLLSPTLLHVFGIALVVGRVLHAIALMRGILALRVIGMVLTIGVIFAEAVLAIIHYIL